MGAVSSLGIMEETSVPSDLERLAETALERIRAAEGGADALRVCERLRAAGFESRLVGGCVRDALLGLDLLDFDVSTNASPDEVASLFERTRFTGRAFGVSRVSVGSRVIEVSTYRVESDYDDHRHPSRYSWASTLEDDAARRDFTVNAIYLAPDVPVLIDPFDGVGDVERRLLRCVGQPSERFREDALRVLRVSRLAARLGFEIEEATATAARAMAGMLESLPGERICDEMDKGLSCPGRARFVELLIGLGQAGVVLPELAGLRGVRQDPVYHPEGDALRHSILTLDSLDADAELDLVWAAMLHDTGKAETTFRDETGRMRSHGHAEAGSRIVAEIASRLRWSSSRRAHVHWLVANHMRLLDCMKMRPYRLRRLLTHRWGRDLVALLRAERESSGRADTSPEVAFCEARLSEYAIDGIDELPVSGRDLLEMGIPEGPVIGAILERLRMAVAEGETAGDREGLLELARSLRDRMEGDT